MNILLAFDSFKGSLNAFEVIDAVRKGIEGVLPNARVTGVPLADGGEGTAAVLTRALGGEIRTSRVHGPVMAPVSAHWGWIPQTKTAVIEMAQASGLMLVDASARDPFQTTSYGLGELLTAAMDAGAERIIIGLGGSATVDGGTGMAEALGVRFDGCTTPMRGGILDAITDIDRSGLDKRIARTNVHVALDVNNPLLGARGAAAVFGPQKGATPTQVTALERGLQHLASFFPDTATTIPGAGAAGGLGWGLAAFCGAELMSGVDMCLDAIGFDALLAGVDLVLTGEGSFDRQSLDGKVPAGVARRAAAKGIPTVVLAGRHDASLTRLEKEYGIASVHSIVQEFGCSEDRAVRDAAVLLQRLAEVVVPRLVRTEST